MNFSDVITSLNQASAFDLYRMRAAIDRVLADPKWLQAIQARLQVGQEVSYFSVQANTLKRAKVLEFRRKQVILRNLDDAQSWIIDYAAINIDGADVQIREHKSQGLGRNEIAIGETLGFLDREQQHKTGTVIRLNDKTVSLQCGNSRWRVHYSHLHRVLDSDGQAHDVIEVTGQWTSPNAQLT